MGKAETKEILLQLTPMVLFQNMQRKKTKMANAFSIGKWPYNYAYDDIMTNYKGGGLTWW